MQQWFLDRGANQCDWLDALDESVLRKESIILSPFYVLCGSAVSMKACLFDSRTEIEIGDAWTHLPGQTITVELLLPQHHNEGGKQ
jgi:hypothetical protein